MYFNVNERQCYYKSERVKMKRKADGEMNGMKKRVRIKKMKREEFKKEVQRQKDLGNYYMACVMCCTELCCVIVLNSVFECSNSNVRTLLWHCVCRTILHCTVLLY